MFKRKCKITFIRHGSTIYTDNCILNDDIEYPGLNEIGKKEVEKTAKWILERGLKVDKLYTGPCIAEIKTAMIISKVLKIDYEVIDSLLPKVYGKWAGLNFNQIMEKYPQEFELYKNDKLNYAPENGESLFQLNKRVDENLSKIIKENLTKRIFIVTNSDIIQSVVRNALNIPPYSQTNVNIQPASATQVSFFKDFSMLMYSNYVPFL